VERYGCDFASPLRESQTLRVDGVDRPSRVVVGKLPVVALPLGEGIREL